MNNITIELNDIPMYESGKIQVTDSEDMNYFLPILFLLSIFTFYYLYQTYMKYETVTLEGILKQIEEGMINGIEWFKVKMNELLLFLHTDKEGAIRNSVSE